MISALFDTNVLYSALISPRGSAGLLLRLAVAGKFELWVSSGVLGELEAILSRPKAKKELGLNYTTAEIKDLLDNLSGAFFNVGECPLINIVTKDPKDNHVISAAVSAQVDYLVSGDKKHILPLKTHTGLRALGLKIATLAEFMEILAGNMA